MAGFVGGLLQLDAFPYTTTTGDNDDVVLLGTQCYVSVTTNNDAITGIATPQADVLLFLINTDATKNFVVKNNSSSSAVGNRILTADGNDITVPPLRVVALTYEPIGAVWHAVSLVGTLATVTSVAAGTGLTGGTITTTGTIALDLTRANTWANTVTVIPVAATAFQAQSTAGYYCIDAVGFSRIYANYNDGSGNFPALMLDLTLGSTPATNALVLKGNSSQTGDLQQWRKSDNTVLAAVLNNGAFRPAHLADSAAANDSIYYSTTANKLVYKDGGGTVNNLY